MGGGRNETKLDGTSVSSVVPLEARAKKRGGWLSPWKRDRWLSEVGKNAFYSGLGSRGFFGGWMTGSGRG